MADVKDIIPHLDKLDEQLDRLEDALSPLLNNLNERASQLPLLDKAKLFSLTAYSIESLLFSYLRLQGSDAQNHAVYTELKRVQQYFGKIKAVEEPEGARTLVVNQEAAARILKADLAGHKTLSNKLAEKISEERAKALLRSVEGRKRPADDSGASAAEGDEAQGSSRKRRQNGKGRGKPR